ncbi:unnamed protein product [Prunus armeniaca]
MARHFPAQLSDGWAFGMLGASVRARDLQDNKRLVRPRAPVRYQPKALRCLNFRCGTVDIDCGPATCPGEEGCPNRGIGVPQVLFREFSEGNLIFSSASEIPSDRLVIQLMEGLNLGPSVRSHLEIDVGKVKRSLQARSDGTEGRFVFRAPSVVMSSTK